MWPKVHRNKVALLACAPLLLTLILLAALQAARPQPATPLSVILRMAAQHRIASALIEADGTVQFETRDGQTLLTHKEPGQVMTPLLMADGASTAGCTRAEAADEAETDQSDEEL